MSCLGLRESSEQAQSGHVAGKDWETPDGQYALLDVAIAVHNYTKCNTHCFTLIISGGTYTSGVGADAKLDVLRWLRSSRDAFVTFGKTTYPTAFIDGLQSSSTRR